MTVEILELLRMGRIITGARKGVLDGHSEISTVFVGKPPLLQGVGGGFASHEIRLPRPSRGGLEPNPRWDVQKYRTVEHPRADPKPVHSGLI